MMNSSFKRTLNSILIMLMFSSFFIGFSHTGDHTTQGKLWILNNPTKSVKADFISLNNHQVYLKDVTSHTIVNYPLTDFSMVDQYLILKQDEFSKKINRQHPNQTHLTAPIQTKKISKNKAEFGLLILVLLIVSIIFYFGFSKTKKPALAVFYFSLFVLVLVACAPEEEEDIPDTIQTSDPVKEDTTDSSSDNTSTDTTSDSDTSSTDTDSNNDSSDSNSTSDLISTIVSHFSDFSGVTITSDDDHFYIHSYSWPEHGMGVGITSWQEQVPIPQNYTGDNSWVIPINPKMADEPLSTSDHLLKGALAVAVNGVPIFNVFNNRGENAYLIGELDNWGGHFGRGDDYHYHLIPTHLEETVGTDQPLAYALDGYPVYGYTDETLDDAFGRYDSDGNYRYHAKTTEPYYMPYVMGEIVIDPNSTAPEDQIYPQPVQNPVRPSNGFKPVNNATVTAFTQTGTNAFSFEYTVGEVKYYVNYNWDENCKFTYTYVDENGGTTNIPTYGAISDTSVNVEVYNNVSFCQDVNLGEASDEEVSSSDSNTSSDDTEEIGFSATSTISDFTLSSIAIDSECNLLDNYKCEDKVNGIEKSIPIAWSNVPDETTSLAISIHGFPNQNETNSYLTLWNIDPTNVTEIEYGGANDGAWYMGPNKDGASISYSSPCSPNGATQTYYMTLYALSKTPPSLPEENSLTVDYGVLVDSLSEVTIIDQVVLEYVSSSN